MVIDQPFPTSSARLFEEHGQVVALCPELNVSSFGDTRLEAVELFLEACHEMGTLETVLEEAGYSRKSPIS